MELTNEDVADILALLDSLPYDEFDLQTPRFRLTLRRAPGGGWTQESQVTADPVAANTVPSDITEMSGKRDDGTTGMTAGNGGAASRGGGRAVIGVGEQSRVSERGGDVQAGSTGRADGDGSEGGGDAGEGRAGLVAVRAPLPGTFYRAPRPGAAAFVEVGDVVGTDTVVAIVETMKLMNSVHAGASGRVAEICLANADPVAQGAAIMLIEPAPAGAAAAEAAPAGPGPA